MSRVIAATVCCEGCGAELRFNVTSQDRKDSENVITIIKNFKWEVEEDGVLCPICSNTDLTTSGGDA